MVPRPDEKVRHLSLKHAMPGSACLGTSVRRSAPGPGFSSGEPTSHSLR